MKTTNVTVSMRIITPRDARELLTRSLPPEVADDLQRKRASADQLTTVLNDAEKARAVDEGRVNRLISPRTWKKYARDMAAGEWLVNAQTIQVDTAGLVRDGWHRLLAVIDSKQAQQFAVATNVDPAAQLVTDIGRGRSTSDQLRLFGYANPTQLGAAATLLIRWRANKILLSAFIPSVTEVRSTIDNTPELTEGVKAAASVKTQLPRAPISVLAAIYAEASTLDEAARDEFFKKLFSGEELDAGNPILTLRRQIIRYEIAGRGRTDSRMFTQPQKLYQAIRAWNGWRKNDTLQTLRVPNELTSDSFPTLV